MRGITAASKGQGCLSTQMKGRDEELFLSANMSGTDQELSSATDMWRDGFLSLQACEEIGIEVVDVCISW